MTDIPDDPSRRDLARIGIEFHHPTEPLNGIAWGACLRALASYSGDDPRSEMAIKLAAGQVYGAIRPPAEPSRADAFVRTFLAVYNIEDTADVDDLLGRETTERENYEGQLAFVREAHDGGDDARD